MLSLKLGIDLRMMRSRSSRRNRLWSGYAALAAAFATLAIVGGVALGTEGVGGDQPTANVEMPASERSLPSPPSDPRAAKVYAAFDEFCAGCHQAGKLQIPAPARPLANILAIDELASDLTVVRPGLPDASPLYTIMLRQHGAAGISLPSSTIQAVRDWIAELPEPAANCGGRPKITQLEVEQAIGAAIGGTAAEKRKDLRFIVLSHLADACVAPATLAGYRQAITKLVNGLSWRPEPVRIEPIGPDATILKLDISELGWVSAHWDKLVQNYPYAAFATTRLNEYVRRETGTVTPIVRADWLAYATTATPLYAQLLGLPGRMANLQRILNVDLEADIVHARARRGGLVKSEVTRANRIVERHAVRTGGLWLAYDFATSDGRQNILANPLGPSAGGAVKTPFKHDGTRALFTLPNGFLGFSVNDPRGDRVEVPGEGIDRDEVSWSGIGGNAASCIACHAAGPFPIKDAVRPQAEADNGVAKELRELTLALYAPQGELDGLVADDRKHYREALQRAGVDPDLTIAGLEPVTALAREYTRDVGLFRLAAEAGLSVVETRRRMAMLPPELQPTVLRVLANGAPRGEADRLLVRLAPDAGSAETNVVVAQAPDQRDDFELLLWSQSDSYQSGQLATFHARSSQNCYLTLISVDRGGQATVLFPNEFEQNNLLVAGKDLMLPAAGAAYQLRLREKGRETLVGVCQTSPQPPDAIQHDFERQRFTMLGDWRAYLGNLASVHAKSASPLPRARPQRGARARPAAPADVKPDTTAVTELQARAAISYEVR